MRIYFHLLFSFVVGFVISDALGGTHSDKLYAAFLSVLITLLINDVPWVIAKHIKQKMRKA